MKNRLVDPLAHVEKQTAAPVELPSQCPVCGQTMEKAYSSGKRIVYCSKDGVALPEDHFDEKRPLAS